MGKGRIFLWLILSAVVAAAGSGELCCLAEETEESVHITTYYPSPYGSYQELSSEIIQFRSTDGPPDRVFGREEKGMFYFDDDDGLQYYDGHEWKPVASPGEGSTAALVNSLHTEGDCIKAGGTPVSAGVSGSSVNQCRFTLSTCPTGWTQYKDWSTTDLKSPREGICVDDIIRYYKKAGKYRGDNVCSVDRRRGGCNGATTGNEGSICYLNAGTHSWSNTAQERCWYPSDGNSAYYYPQIKQVGCY